VRPDEGDINPLEDLAQTAGTPKTYRPRVASVAAATGRDIQSKLNRNMRMTENRSHIVGDKLVGGSALLRLDLNVPRN
jgi:hypothetical protein